MRALVLTVLVTVALAACEPAPERPAGTQRMADTLAARVAAAEAAPMPYFVLNTLRADRLEADLGRYRGDDLLRARFDLARERLNAGDTDAAIRQLVDVAERSGGVDAAGGAARPIYDLLATAYLRRGEQANCLANHHAGEVCVLPFRGAAVHDDPDGARRAADVLADLLETTPGDLGSRWLLNVAHHALGSYPDGVPADWRIDGLDAPGGARWANVAPHRGAAVDGISGGVSAEDFDGDGDVDLLVTSYGLRDPIRYFENRQAGEADGGGRFAERTEAAGLVGLTGGLNTVHGDVDNDGDVDVLVLRGGWFGAVGSWPNSLLLNDGAGRFEDATYAAGLGSEHPTQTAAFADVDGDGDLDLFVGNESGGAYPDALGATGASAARPSELFLNEGVVDGVPRFREAAAEAGLALAAFVKGVAFGDVEGDGRLDLYVSVLGGPNRLYLNRSEGGRVRFEEAAASAGVEAPAFSFPVAWLDADGDGRDDLLVVSYDVRHFFETPADAAREALGLPPTAETTRLFLNRGDGTFRDASAEAGLDLPLFGMGLGVGDLDGDGRLDLYVGTGAPDLRSLIPNRAFLNRSSPGAPRFEDVTLSSGLGHLQKGHAVAFADLDGDGDEDLYEVMGGAVEGDRARNVLFENPSLDRKNAADRNRFRWVSLRLEGRRANRSAVGARLAVTLRQPDGTTRTLWRTVGTGGSFGAGSLAVDLGLGDAEAVEAVTVRWPGGAQEAITGVAPGGRYRIVEGTGRAEAAGR